MGIKCCEPKNIHRNQLVQQLCHAFVDRERLADALVQLQLHGVRHKRTEPLGHGDAVADAYGDLLPDRDTEPDTDPLRHEDRKHLTDAVRHKHTEQLGHEHGIGVRFSDALF